MTLHFVIIVMLCNSLGCYWGIDDPKVSFTDQNVCATAAMMLKSKSGMYFDTACMVVATPTN